MIQKAILVLVFCICCFCGYSQSMQSISYYTTHPDISQEAKDYYARLFNANNSDKIYGIMDSIFTDNSDTRPFYIFLACRMITEANGDLLSELNIICRHLAELFPVSLASVLFADKAVIDDKYKELWAKRMSVEIRITCDSDLMSCFKKSRSTALQNCNEQYKNKMEVLYNMVRKDLNLFQQG